LSAISSHNSGKTAGKTTSSQTKRAGVTDVIAAIGHGREARTGRRPLSRDLSLNPNETVLTTRDCAAVFALPGQR
jgi:hypothetical protein